jgi:hypothetical protein
MCGCGKEAFMGVEMPNQNVYDVGATGLVSQPSMFGTESQNTSGVEQSIALTSATQIGMN